MPLAAPRAVALSAAIVTALAVGACGSSSSPTIDGDTPPSAPRAPTPPSTGEPGAGSGDVATPSSTDAIAARAAAWLEGEFDSSAQAKADPGYFAISLAICPVPFAALAPRVLYVEQARVGSAPYRQRLYVVEGVDAKTARSRVFEANDPTKLVGLCKDPSRAVLRVEDFVERAGCDVALHWTGDRFVGHTPDAKWSGSEFVRDEKGARCPSTLNGASYATSEVTLERTKMVSWDRGFDDSGKQAWGAVKGGYEFVRKTPLRDPDDRSRENAWDR